MIKNLGWIISIVWLGVSFASPIIVLQSPVMNQSFVYSPVKVSGTVAGAKMVLVNGKEIPLFHNKFQTMMDIPQSGLFDIYVVAVDEAFEKAEVKRTVTILRPFPDTLGHFAKKEIEWLAALGILGGLAGTDFFSPNTLMTRGEMAEVLCKFNHISLIGQSASYVFSDLLTTHWAYPYIQAALKHDLITALTSDSFGPDSLIQRAECLVLLKNHYKILHGTSIKSFADISPDFHARSLIEQLSGTALLPPQWVASSTFLPDKGVTRGEMAYLLARLLEQRPVVETLRTSLGSASSSGQIFFNLEKTDSPNLYFLRFNPDVSTTLAYISFTILADRKFELYMVDNGEIPDQFSQDRTFSAQFISAWDFFHQPATYSYQLFDENNSLLLEQHGKMLPSATGISLIPDLIVEDERDEITSR